MSLIYGFQVISNFFLVFSPTHFSVSPAQQTVQHCYSVCGYATETASFMPARQSAHITGMPFTLRFFSSFNTPSHYFASSFSSIRIDKTLLWSTEVTIRITHIASFFLPVVTNWEINCVNENDRINHVKRTILPFLYLRRKPVSGVRNHSIAYFKSVNFLNGFVNLTYYYSLCVQGNYLLVNARNIPFVFLDYVWIKCDIAIPRHFDLSFEHLLNCTS